MNRSNTAAMEKSWESHSKPPTLAIAEGRKQQFPEVVFLYQGPPIPLHKANAPSGTQPPDPTTNSGIQTEAQQRQFLHPGSHTMMLEPRTIPPAHRAVPLLGRALSNTTGVPREHCPGLNTPGLGTETVTMGGESKGRKRNAGPGRRSGRWAAEEATEGPETGFRHVLSEHSRDHHRRRGPGDLVMGKEQDSLKRQRGAKRLPGTT